MLDKLIDPKFTEEKIVITYDFTSELSGLDVLSGEPVASFKVVKGTDATPDAMANGAAVIDSSNKRVLLPVQGGIVGNSYKIKVVSSTTNPNIVLARSAIISIE